MERPVKERLVGAAVLLAAAVILIPEMLSGPEPEEPQSEAAEQPAAVPLKTYTIDLSASSGSQTASAGVEERAPPPESVPRETSPPPASSEPEPAPVAQVKPEPTVEQSPKDTAAAASEPPLRQAAPAPKPAPTPAAAQVASAHNVPTSSGWAVQLGSFSKEATAQRLAQELKGQGHSAFVMPVRSGGATLYRVRIGPMKDRSSAEAVQARVRAKTPNAAVVQHP